MPVRTMHIANDTGIDHFIRLSATVSISSVCHILSVGTLDFAYVSSPNSVPRKMNIAPARSMVASEPVIMGTMTANATNMIRDMPMEMNISFMLSMPFSESLYMV